MKSTFVATAVALFVGLTVLAGVTAIVASVSPSAMAEQKP